MAGDFVERIQRLIDQTGHGDLEGRCQVNQVYARYQHEGVDLIHREGGQAKYLEQPVLAAAEDYLAKLGKRALEPGGLREGMAEVAEDMSRAVFEHAPFEFGDLRASGHPTVVDGGETVYDRPPRVHRLTEEELRAKGHLRALGFGNR